MRQCELKCFSGLTRGLLPILISIHMASKVLRILCSTTLELLAILLMCALVILVCDRDDNRPSCRHLTCSSTLTIVLCFAMGAGEAKPSDPDHTSLHFFDELLVMFV